MTRIHNKPDIKYTTLHLSFYQSFYKPVYSNYLGNLDNSVGNIGHYKTLTFLTRMAASSQLERNYDLLLIYMFGELHAGQIYRRHDLCV